MRGKITKTAVDKLEPTIREDGSRAPNRLWDTDVTGFGCLATKAGTKSFIFQYRLKGQARGTAPKRITIGKFGDVTPDQARAIARDLLLDVRGGKDPKEKWGGQQNRTVADLASHYLEEHLPRRKKVPRPATIRNYRILVERHLLPALGGRQVADIERQDIERLHLSMRETPYQANRMLSSARQLFVHAERLGWRPNNSNPVNAIEKYPEERRGAKKEVMLTPEQMRLLLRAIEDFRGDEGDPYAAAAIEFVFWTGWRINEVLALRWDDVDVERSVARLRETKTSEEEYRVLPAEASAVLLKVARSAVSPHVFVGRDGRAALTTVKRPWERIRKLADLDGLEGLGPLRLHDLRHNTVSWDVSRGTSLEMAGKAVGHRSRQATEVYAHFAPDALRRSANERAAAMRKAINSR
ncbi:MAG: DUF4102 domain-containing protein [Acidobacteria bacterium]|nr:MAG: DUF4102 domain-containing protein [Acidobacteriota bacterium]REK04447.1 MAG: DUF4102 domain-containing protein [Acidobacteriota bacterium]